jgi:hypothetical protein
MRGETSGWVRDNPPPCPSRRARALPGLWASHRARAILGPRVSRQLRTSPGA